MVRAAMATICLGALALPGIPIFFPDLNDPTQADAVLVLGPSTPQRLAAAHGVAKRVRPRAVVISAHPDDLAGAIPEPCEGTSDLPVYCFDPDPATTQGESRAFAELARRHGWRRVAVVTFRPQASRARMLVGRCFDGHIDVVDSREHFPWAYMYLYQSGAFAKSLVRQGC